MNIYITVVLLLECFRYFETFMSINISIEIIKDKKRTFFDDPDVANVHSRHASERIKKKKKIVDLKALVGCKLLSKSEKNLQKMDFNNDVVVLERVNVDYTTISYLFDSKIRYFLTAVP